MSCFNGFGTDVFHDRRKRVDHDWKEEIDGTDDDGGICIEELDCWQMNGLQCLVDDTVLGKNGDPGKTSDDCIGQKREEDQGIQKSSLFLWKERKPIGSWETDQDTKHCSDEGKLDGSVEDGSVEVILEEGNIGTWIKEGWEKRPYQR